jgi:predicted RNA binding protein YcfA (HicA-like mRNA interferase family)
MPSLNDLPGDLNRKKLSKALERLGFSISTKGGKGSHFKATHIKTQKSITIPSRLDKQVLKYVLKEIEECSGVTWEQLRPEI